MSLVPFRHLFISTSTGCMLNIASSPKFSSQLTKPSILLLRTISSSSYRLSHPIVLYNHPMPSSLNILLSNLPKLWVIVCSLLLRLLSGISSLRAFGMTPHFFSSKKLLKTYIFRSHTTQSLKCILIKLISVSITIIYKHTYTHIHTNTYMHNIHLLLLNCTAHLKILI